MAKTSRTHPEKERICNLVPTSIVAPLRAVQRQ
jgi:hypothetical protein